MGNQTSTASQDTQTKQTLVSIQNMSLSEWKSMYAQLSSKCQREITQCVASTRPDRIHSPFYAQQLVMSGDADDLIAWAQDSENKEDINEWIPEVISGKEYRQRTMLHLACFYGKENIVRALCELGANVDVLDKRQRPAIFYAAEMKSLPIVKFLREEQHAAISWWARNNRRIVLVDLLKEDFPDGENAHVIEYLSESIEYWLDRKWTSMGKRDRFKEIEQQLREFESILRRRDDLLELDEEMKSAFLVNKPQIDQLLSELRAMFESEIGRCRSNEEYRSGLKYFLDTSPENRKFRAMHAIYLGIAHKLIADDPTWDATKLDEMSLKFKDNHPGPQPISDLVSSFPLIVVTQNNLHIRMLKLAQLTNGILYDEAGCKSLVRAFSKMALHRTRRWEPNIWDLARALISYKTIGSIAFAIDMLQSKALFPHIRIVQMENRFKQEPSDEWQTVFIHLKILFDENESVESALICELQLCLKDLTLARKSLGGHAAYSMYRNAQEISRYVDFLDK